MEHSSTILSALRHATGTKKRDENQKNLTVNNLKYRKFNMGFRFFFSSLFLYEQYVINGKALNQTKLYEMHERNK
jgi:hypothetical protein